MPTTTPLRQSSASYTLAFANSATTSLGALTRSERREHDQLTHDAHRRDWLAGRFAAKRAIAARYGVSLPLDQIQLEPRSSGAPRCMIRDDVERWTLAPLFLSIAHRDGVAIAAAASSATRVGVDIELVSAIESDHYRYFLSPGELSVDATLVWVLKEAVWKALGLGRDVPFKSVRLAFARGTDKLRGVWVESSWMRARARVLSVPDRHDLVAAVVEIEQEPQ